MNYILIILILIIIVIYFETYENFENENSEINRGLLILYGESFREGGQNSRERDCDNSYKTQKIASESHTDFCKFIKEKYNIYMDISITTYDTKYEKDLKSWYNNLVYYKSYKELIGTKNISHSAINNNDSEKYSFMFITRMDIYIKKDYYPIFNPYWDKIYYF